MALAWLKPCKQSPSARAACGCWVYPAAWRGPGETFLHSVTRSFPSQAARELFKAKGKHQFLFMEAQPIDTARSQSACPCLVSVLQWVISFDKSCSGGRGNSFIVIRKLCI